MKVSGAGYNIISNAVPNIQAHSGYRILYKLDPRVNSGRNRPNLN